MRLSFNHSKLRALDTPPTHLNTADIFTVNRGCNSKGTMLTPTTINEEYDVIIAGGSPSSHFLLPLLTERACDRRHCWLHHREPSCDGGPRPADPRARGGSHNTERSGTQASRTVDWAHRTRITHRARVCEPPKRCARWPLGDRAWWAVCRWWR